MSTSPRLFLRLVVSVFILLGSAAASATAQDSKSSALAKELTALLDQGKLDAIAAREPASQDTYVAALYFAGSQLLVVSARYAVPVLLNEQLTKKNYRDIYIDLNSACVAGTRTLVVDLMAEGLKARRAEGEAFDTFESPKPPWRPRKEAHLSRIATVPDDALVVLAADKLANVRSLAAGYRKEGDRSFDRFHGKREGTLWYARAVADALLGRRRSPLAEELDRAVRELEELARGGR